MTSEQEACRSIFVWVQTPSGHKAQTPMDAEGRLHLAWTNVQPNRMMIGGIPGAVDAVGVTHRPYGQLRGQISSTGQGTGVTADAPLLVTEVPITGPRDSFFARLSRLFLGTWLTGGQNGPLLPLELSNYITQSNSLVAMALRQLHHTSRTIRTSPPGNNSSITKRVLGRLGINLVRYVTIPQCCSLHLQNDSHSPAYPEFVPDPAASEKQMMQPARAYLQRMFPRDVLVLMVDDRDSLTHYDAVNLVHITGKTDFILVDKAAALRILGDGFNVDQQQPSEMEIDLLMRYAVVGLVEFKTPREIAGNAYRYWAQAVLEGVALWYITGRALPVFVGDLNHMVLVHWVLTQQEPSLSDSDDVDEGQQQQQQPVNTVHVADALSREAAHAAMRLMISEEQARLRATDTYQQQQQEQQSPGGNQGAARSQPSAAGDSLQQSARAASQAAQPGVQTRSQRTAAAASGAYNAHADWGANAAVSAASFAVVIEAAIEDIEEGIEECADADLSTLDQYRGVVCDPSRRFYHTLKYNLPAALADEHSNLSSQT